MYPPAMAVAIEFTVGALVSADDVKRDVFVECLVALFQPLEIPATPADARWLYH